MADPDFVERIPLQGEWDAWDGELEEEGPATTRSWRKPVLIAVAAVTAIAMLLVPLYNLFWARTVADNGLEVCGFDYCVVQEAAVEAGVDLTMSRLFNTYLDQEEARALARQLTDVLGVRPVGVELVDDLEGRLGGVYDPATRSIRIARPARAWTVLHEVAHTVESGHGADFQEVVIDLAREVGSDAP